jgi:two-component system, cell cycle response regulator
MRSADSDVEEGMAVGDRETPAERSAVPEEQGACVRASVAERPAEHSGERRTPRTGTRILVVDDESTLRSVIAEVLTDDGHTVTQAANAEEALALFREAPFPLVITDIVMGKMSGLDLLTEVKVLDPESLVIIMTSHASLETATAALRTGAYDFLIKPFEDLGLITAVVNRATEKHQLLTQNLRLVENLRRNAEELEELNRNLKDMVNRDGLTGLFNHRYFRDALEIELARSRRHGHSFGLIFIDVDHFKHYNDTHGHLAGDDVLKGLARILTDHGRCTNVCARYGGEEFVVLIPEVDKRGAHTVAEKIRKMVEEYPFRGGGSQPLGTVTISLGVAGYPGDGADSQTLIARADQALYAAKQEGRNRVCGWAEGALTKGR